MNFKLRPLFLSMLMTVFVSCGSWQEPAAVSELEPVIFPDYSAVTVPCNIAPMNFMVEDATYIQAVFHVGGAEACRVKGNEGVINIPQKKWKEILSSAAGTSVSVEVSVWDAEHPDGLRYRPFEINIAPEEMDPWIVYRLIEPGYVGWRQLGIYQREISSFDESAIVTNKESNTTCLNCHNFPSYSSKSMMFHARGANGGTILYNDGRLDKIDFNNTGPKKNATYPAWHPSGRFIAFSSNTTHQLFYAEGRQPIEVFDSASDMMLYDIHTGEVLMDMRFQTKEALESYPAWSPDGNYMYFVSADDVDLDENFTPAAMYHLLRVPFDSQTRSFGEKVDTLYNARKSGASASYPRVSPDGRYLLYTLSDYGTFPIWHDRADLGMMDLQTMEDVDISMWNDSESADSYHSWSSNGRWVMYGTRRIDGRYTRVYLAHFSEDGTPDKPFLLPQEDPRHNMWRLMSYNVPEFIDGEVALPEEAEELFYHEGK